jgi:hypothetical protein
MISLETNLALRKTLADYCAARDRAITVYTNAMKAIAAESDDLSKIAPHLWPYDATPRVSVAHFIKDLDARMWRVTWDQTELPKYMDAQARREFSDSLESAPPAFTLDNLRSALISSASQAQEMFARGLYEMFRDRDMDYVTNAKERVKIPRRLIWNGGYVDIGMGRLLRFSYSSWHSDRLGDLDRVFKTLAGLQYHPRELVNALNQAWSNGGNLYEDTFYRIRGYRNGNLHIELLQQRLIDMANRILANYAGPALAQEAAA